MSVGTGTSFIISAMLSIVLFCGMQIYRHWLAASALQTIFGGYLSSMLFVLILTAVGNIETAVFGKAFQTKLFPEVVMCLLLAVSAASMIHRVCITICILLSVVSLYYMNKLSQVVYATPVAVPGVQGKKEKRKLMAAQLNNYKKQYLKSQVFENISFQNLSSSS